MPAPAPIEAFEYRKKVAEALVRHYGVEPQDAMFCTHYFEDDIRHGIGAPAHDYDNRGKMRSDYPAYTAGRIWDRLSVSYFIVKNATTRPAPPRIVTTKR